jgi:predicted ATPase
MAIKELSVTSYRSIRDLRFRLRASNILTGPNGCGKSNLYNSLFLLSKAARGGLSQAIAEEGGMESVLWAGRRQKRSHGEPLRMTIAAATDQFSYSMSCGLPACAPGDPTAFRHDPEVKEEFVWFGAKRTSRNTFFERTRAGTWARDRDCRRVSYSGELLRTESILSQLRDPHLYPELSALRGEISSWRFYHQFRTDQQSPLRQPQIGVRTPILSHDGRDLAAALQTIDEVGDAESMREAIRSAFRGAELIIDSEGSRFTLFLEMPDLERRLSAQEFSDGTCAIFASSPPCSARVRHPSSP